MPIFDIETEGITVLDTGDNYISKTYFDENQLFKQLETYHSDDK